MLRSNPGLHLGAHLQELLEQAGPVSMQISDDLAGYFVLQPSVAPKVCRRDGGAADRLLGKPCCSTLNGCAISHLIRCWAGGMCEGMGGGIGQVTASIAQ